jgi:hypothetical protein
MKPIVVEVISPMVTTLGHCTRCGLVFRESGVEDKANFEALQEYPKEFREDSLRLSALIDGLVQTYRHRIHIQLISAQSFYGLYKLIRHRIRKYPAFVVNSRDVCTGWKRESIEELLDRHIRG